MSQSYLEHIHLTCVWCGEKITLPSDRNERYHYRCAKEAVSTQR